MCTTAADVPDGYIEAKFTEPDQEYWDWSRELCAQAKKETPLKSAIEVFTEGKKDHSNLMISVHLLAERWNVPWQVIRAWLEKGEIPYNFCPIVSGVNPNSDGVAYYYRLGIPIAEVEKIENIYPELKNIANKHISRIEEKEEKARCQRSKEQSKKLSRIEHLCKFKKISIEQLEDIILNLETEPILKQTQVTELYSELEAAQCRIKELEQLILTAKNKSVCDGKGLSALVCHMRREGKTDEEIAAYLHDDGTWCTQAQVGALLHVDENRIASESMQQRARRLLGKA